MLKAAVKSRIPIIAIRTDDPLNIQAVLESVLEEDVAQFSTGAVVPKTGAQIEKHRFIPERTVCFTMDTDFLWPELYSTCVKRQSVVIVVNPETVEPAMFDAGIVHLPDAMLKDFVKKYADESEHYELIAALRGLSLKEVVETSKLAMASSGEFTAESVLSVRRRRAVLTSGLKLVDTKLNFYDPPKRIEQWLELDGRLFTANVDRVIRPRGLLFHGQPGTGKTCAAKHIAHKLRVPLYLLDVGGVMYKYVGESERNFQAALSQIETLSPCVMLLDEVEKLFGTTDDSGVSSRVLGMLLWWLQEHQAQVLTLMTTNDSDEIPPELIRPGRIDSAMYFRGLEQKQVSPFMTALFANLKGLVGLGEEQVACAVAKAESVALINNGVLSQAQATQIALDFVKSEVVKNLKE